MDLSRQIVLQVVLTLAGMGRIALVLPKIGLTLAGLTEKQQNQAHIAKTQRTTQDRQPILAVACWPAGCQYPWGTPWGPMGGMGTHGGPMGTYWGQFLVCLLYAF